MTSNLDYILLEVIVDELLILWWPRAQDLLDNMIAIDVMSQRYEVFDQIIAQLYLMFLKFENFDYFLDWPCPMHVFAERKWVVFYGSNRSCELWAWTLFDNLLDKIISKWILHEVLEAGDRARKHNLKYFLIVVFCDQILQESTTSLVLSKDCRIFDQCQQLFSWKFITSFKCLVSWN